MADETETPTPTPAPWHAALDEDLRAGLTAKGWDKLEVDRAAVELTKAWKNAEKMVGLPAEQLLRMPKDLGDTAGWEALYARLGAPKEAKDYDFSGAKLDENLTSVLRNTAHALHLNPAGAQELAKAFAGHLEATEQRAAAERKLQGDNEERELRHNWGNRYDVNEFLAKQAIEKLGLPVEFGKALQGQVGYAKTMDALLKLGGMMQEPKFQSGETGGGEQPMTRAQAVAEMDALKQDRSWYLRWIAGDSNARRDFDRLTRQMVMGPQ